MPSPNVPSSHEKILNYGQCLDFRTYRDGIWRSRSGIRVVFADWAWN